MGAQPIPGKPFLVDKEESNRQRSQFEDIADREVMLGMIRILSNENRDLKLKVESLLKEILEVKTDLHCKAVNEGISKSSGSRSISMSQESGEDRHKHDTFIY